LHVANNTENPINDWVNRENSKVIDAACEQIDRWGLHNCASDYESGTFKKINFLSNEFRAFSFATSIGEASSEICGH
jgi:7-keto-8-aminopelargonate synthetase-like enzyme